MTENERTMARVCLSLQDQRDALQRELHAAQAELEWWRHFRAKLGPTSDFPRVGSPLLGRRWNIVEDRTEVGFFAGPPKLTPF